MNHIDTYLSMEHKEYLIQNIEVVDIETSTACNRKCSYCPNSKHNNALIKNNSFMNEEVFTKIVSDLWKVWYKWEICLQRYNEPLLDKRIPKLISIASKNVPEATIVIYSNGDYLTLELYKELVDCWVNKLTVTQHWSKPSKWLKEVINYKENNPDGIIFKFKKMDQKWKFYNRWGEIDLSPDQTKNFFCKATNCITINSNWDFILCCNDYHSNNVFWNVSEENLLDIYLWKEFQNIRMEAITGYFSREICNICMYWKT